MTDGNLVMVYHNKSGSGLWEYENGYQLLLEDKMMHLFTVTYYLCIIFMVGGTKFTLNKVLI